jgi:NADH-quinone oxidoreductase subunit N
MTPLVAAAGFAAPHLDYHALAPELILTAVIVVVLVVDLLLPEREKWATSDIAGLGLLAAFIPILTLAAGDHRVRSMFDGAYVVDNFALVLKALFLLAAYGVVLMSVNYVHEGDYYEGEYYFLLLSSVLGMVVMASARDLITIFVALELLSIPAYLLAGWRKRDLKSNEASLKYYLLGVLASAVMLYGMSLLFGATGSTLLTGIHDALASSRAADGIVVAGILLTVVGFAFKVSAVPFHQWAPDTYEGAPTPITAFLSVSSKTAGFVALLQLVFVGFLGRGDIWSPLFWVLAALTMTVGNLIALRQTNIVRLLAYSSVAQAGYMLVPFAVLGESPSDAAVRSAFAAVVVYLLIYAAMNLGAFAVVIAVARKTRSGEIASYGGLVQYAPGMAVLMTIFLGSLAGVPPLAGWYAKLVVVRAILDAGSAWAVALGVVLAVNTAIAAYYYFAVAREMWMRPVPDDDRTPVRVPTALQAGLLLAAGVVVVVGVYPNLFGRFGDISLLVR